MLFEEQFEGGSVWYDRQSEDPQLAPSLIRKEMAATADGEVAEGRELRVQEEVSYLAGSQHADIEIGQ